VVLVEDTDKTWRITARADVHTALGMHGADHHERRSGNEIATMCVDQRELLGASQGRRVAVEGAKLAYVGKIGQMLDHLLAPTFPVTTGPFVPTVMDNRHGRRRPTAFGPPIRAAHAATGNLTSVA
jgi:hypothetical protein